MRAKFKKAVVRLALLLTLGFVPGGCVGPPRSNDPVPLIICGAVGHLPSRPGCESAATPPDDEARTTPKQGFEEPSALLAASAATDTGEDTEGGAKAEAAVKMVALDFPVMVITGRRVAPHAKPRAPATFAAARAPVEESSSAWIERAGRLGESPGLPRIRAPFATALAERAERVPDVRTSSNGAASLPQEAVRAALHRQMPRIRHCYESASGEPGMGGLVEVRLAIGPSGTVSEAGTTAGTSRGDGLAQCVLFVTERTGFSPSAGTTEATYRIFFPDVGAAGLAAGRR